MPQPQFLTLAPAVARTATGNGDALDLLALGQWHCDRTPQLLVQSNITGVSGTTPSITFLVQDSIDGGVTWNTIGTFVAQTAANRQVIQITLSGVAQSAGFRWPFNARRVRVTWTVSGTTPSLTGGVTAVLV